MANLVNFETKLGWKCSIYSKILKNELFKIELQVSKLPLTIIDQISLPPFLVVESPFTKIENRSQIMSCNLYDIIHTHFALGQLYP